MKKILYIELSGEIQGGGHRSLLQLLKFIDRTKYLPHVLCAGSGSLVEALKAIHVDVDIIDMKPLSGAAALFRMSGYVRKIFRVIKSRQIDLIHVTAPRAVLIAGLAGRMAGVPLIWHVRIEESDKLYDRLNLWLSDELIVISRAVQKRFQWSATRKKIHLIYNGVDTEDFCPGNHSHPFREQFNLEQEFVVGILGQILEIKGHGELIQAAFRIHPELPRVHFLIAGEENPYKQALQRQVEAMGLTNTVHFYDFCTDVVSLIRSLDLIVVPSYSEAFGRVTIESMACEKPVIATYTGAGREIIHHGDNGYLIPPRDPEALACAVRDLVNSDSIRESLARKGRETVVTFFDIREHVRKVEEVYRGIAG